MHRSLSLSASLGLLLSSSLAACADVPPGDGDHSELSAMVDSDQPALAQVEQAIINGTDYESVVPYLGLARIVGPKLGEIQPFCSGALITPTIAVTAPCGISRLARSRARTPPKDFRMSMSCNSGECTESLGGVQNIFANSATLLAS